MRFAFKTANQYSTWAEILAVWQEADRIDLFESGWVFDHFYPIQSPQREAEIGGSCLEAWSMLGALSQATSRLRLGTLVTGVHHRHPAVLANMVITLDIVSDGRIELGVGAGWNDEESSAYGIELGGLSERFDRFDEALQVLTSLMVNDVTDFAGRYFRLSGARCEPKAVQKPHPPIVIGGVGEKRTIPLVARYAQGWDVFDAPLRNDFARKLDVLHERCSEIERDPKEITVSSHVWFDPTAQDVAGVADRCEQLGAQGVHLAVIYLAPPLDPGILAPLAEALAPLAA